MALLAKEKMEATKDETTFRGYSLEAVDYSLREFTCKACSNFCDIQEFTVEGEHTFWGDKCSDQFRQRAKSSQKAVIDDLLLLREKLLLDGHELDGHKQPAVIGYPRSMYFYEQFPFWNAFWKTLGFRLLPSPKTNRIIINEGLDAVVAEPCFPIKVAHGHVRALLKNDVDFIFLPNVIDGETEFPEVNSHLCPWGQTLPFVVGHAPIMEDHSDKIIKPTIHFRQGMDYVKKELAPLAKRFGARSRLAERAVEAGYDAQRRFQTALREAGERVLRQLQESGDLAIVLVGRPYNINDNGANLDIPRKLRDYYGVNVVPMDFLPIEGIDIREINSNMYWNYGRKILQACRVVSGYPNLHIIYITNFKCGPDSYIKHYVEDATGKPFLTLQFDGHSNDAGFMTRCEAYLDSKGFLRWWKRA